MNKNLRNSIAPDMHVLITEARMLHYLAESAVKNGAMINMTSGTIGSERPSNKTMLKALCKSFMYWYSYNSSRTLALSYSANWSDTLG
jgi:hypothetical protein